MPKGFTWKAKGKTKATTRAPTTLQLDRYRQIRMQHPETLDRAQITLQRRKDLVESRLQNQYKVESDRLTSILESMPAGLLKEEAKLRIGKLKGKIKI